MMCIVLIGVEIVTICVIFFALLLLLNGDGSREQKLMEYFLVGVLVQNTGYLLELTAPTLEAAVVAVKMEYLGSLAIPICYCYFVFIYCFKEAPIRVLKLLGIVDAGLFLLVMTCERHSIYYKSLEWLQAADGHTYLSITYGPGYWGFMIFPPLFPI